MTPRLEPGQPVQMRHAHRSGSTLRGVIIRVSDDRKRVWVAWAGEDNKAFEYRPSELVPAEQDDRGCYVLEVPLW